jgi:hypothetical protein
MSGNGFLYYAVGERWLREAVRSATSLRRVMPDAAVALVTDGSVPDCLFDIVTPPPAGLPVKALKMWSMRHSPFSRTVFLDTDTYVCDAVPELFALLERFPIAAAITPYWTVGLSSAGSPATQDGIPVSFPKLNSGVMAFRRDAETDRFFADWGDRHAAAGYRQDQAPLRQALYYGDIRYAVLPAAYNYRLPYPAGVAGAVKIMHGHVRDLDGLAGRINRSMKWRVTTPVSKVTRQLWYFVKRTKSH